MTNTDTKLQTVLDKAIMHRGILYNPHIFVRLLGQGLKLVTIQLISKEFEWNSKSPINVKDRANEHVLGFVEYITGTYQSFYEYRDAYLAVPSEERNKTADLKFKNQIYDFIWGISKRGHSYNPEEVISYVPCIFVEERVQHIGVGTYLMKEMLSLALSDVYLPNKPLKRQAFIPEIGAYPELQNISFKFEPRDRVTSFLEKFNAVYHLSLPYYNVYVVRKQNK